MINKIYAIILLTFTVLSWGLTIAIAGQAMQFVNPIYFSIIKFFPSAIIMIILLLITEGKQAFTINKQFFILVLIGMCSFLGFNIFIFTGIKYTNSLNASILIATLPIITIIVSSLIFKQKITLPSLIACILTTIVIIYLVLGGNFVNIINFKFNNNFFGIVIILFGLLLSVLSSVLIHKFKSFSVLRYTTITISSGIVLAFIMSLILMYFNYIDAPNIEFIKHFFWQFLFVMILGGAIAQVTWVKSIKLIGINNAIAFANLQPVVVLLYNIIFNIPVHKYEIISTILIIMILFIHSYKIKTQG